MIEPDSWWKEKIAESMDPPLPWRTRMAMRVHYLICAWCERYRDQLGFLRKALRSCPADDSRKFRDKLTPEARTRLKTALRLHE